MIPFFDASRPVNHLAFQTSAIEPGDQLSAAVTAAWHRLKGLAPIEHAPFYAIKFFPGVSYAPENRTPDRDQ